LTIQHNKAVVQQRQQRKASLNSGSVSTTLFVPEDLWRKLRAVATDRHCSQQDVWLTALREHLKMPAGRKPRQ
jgi:hypothetical protein